MHCKDLISKKKRGEALTEEEIFYFVEQYTGGIIPDYQAAAFLMTVYFNSMNADEISHLTQAMAESGDMVDLSGIEGVKVDKHSTGGVGDKISLVVMPLMAALGIPAAKMSGRGLGHTGGTIDKLEAIPGFRTELPRKVFYENVRKHGIALVGQSGNLTPADKKIYALRDAIECVDSIPLIASSIMSKKIASGADVIVLDVKVGKGTFMKTEEDARILAKTMTEIGERLGRKTVAVLTRMDQPLGREIGNACEVLEAIDILRGGGEADEVAVAVEIAAYMAYLAGRFSTMEEARSSVSDLLRSGGALEPFRRLITLQGGDAGIVDEPSRLLKDVPEQTVSSPRKGYICSLDAERIGRAAMLLGAGRMTKEDRIDHQAGIRCLKKIGEAVEAGEAVFLMRSHGAFKEAENLLLHSFEISEGEARIPSVVIGAVE